MWRSTCHDGSYSTGRGIPHNVELIMTKKLRVGDHFITGQRLRVWPSGIRVAAIGVALAAAIVAVALLGGCADQQRELLGPLSVVPIGVFIPW